MFGHKTPTICNAWLGLANYNDNFLLSKCAWVNQQHEFLIAANRWVLKRMKIIVEKSVSWAGRKALDIPFDNLVLLCDHPEGHNKIQDNYRSELFIVKSKHQDPNVYIIKPLNGKGPMCMVNKIQDNYRSELFIVKSKHQDPNVYIIKPLNGKGPMCMVNQQQLFYLQKLQGNDMPSDPTLDTKLPTILVTKPIENQIPQHSHPYCTRSKIGVSSMTLQSSSEDKTDTRVLESSSEYEENSGVIRNLFNCLNQIMVVKR